MDDNYEQYARAPAWASEGSISERMRRAYSVSRLFVQPARWFDPRKEEYVPFKKRVFATVYMQCVEEGRSVKHAAEFLYVPEKLVEDVLAHVRPHAFEDVTREVRDAAYTCSQSPACLSSSDFELNEIFGVELDTIFNHLYT